MLYVMTVGFSSVIPAVFWPEPSTPQDVPEQCEEGLRTQVVELRTHAAQQLDGDPTDLDVFLRGWDDRHLALQPACADDPRHQRAASIRFRLQDTLRRVNREEGRALAQLERSFHDEDVPRREEHD
jgi:uncharacterized membrane protein YccC